MSVATTYAEALYEAAAEGAAVEAVSADLGGLLAAMDDTPELRRVLDAPEVETPAKKAAVADIMTGAHPLARSFVQVLLDRGRISELDEIARAYSARVAVAEGRVIVEATTAVPLTDDLREAIRVRVREETGREAELTEVVDPEIIGGLVLRVGEVVIDGSVRSRLGELGRSLARAPVPVEPEAAAGPAPAGP